MINTDALSHSRDRIARFVGVAAESLTDQHHSNAHPDRRDLLSGLGRPSVEARAREYGGDVLAAAGIELEALA